jgi:hypothetical protein
MASSRRANTAAVGAAITSQSQSRTGLNESAGVVEGPIVLDADQRARVRALLEERMAQVLVALRREAPPGRCWPCDACQAAQPVTAVQVVAGRLLCPACRRPTAAGATAPPADRPP